MRSIYANSLLSEWEQRELRRAVILKRGHTWAKEQESQKESHDTVPVIRIPNIGDRLHLDDLLHLRGVSVEALRASAVSKDWILFVGSNGNPDRIGDSVLIKENRKMVFASFLMGMTSKMPDEILPGFLALWLRLHNVHETFSKTSQQTTGLANFCWGAVKKLPLRFPKQMAEQQAICDFVSRTNDAVEAVERKLAAARRLKTALMQQLFTRGLPGQHRKFAGTKWVQSPASWKLLPLLKIAEIVSGFTMGRDLSGNEVTQLPYLTVINVQEGRLDLSCVELATLKKSEVEALLLRRNDIVMTEGGDRDKLGRGCIWRGEIERCVFQNHVFRIRFKPETYLPELFHFLLQTWQAKNYFYAHAKQTSNLCTINKRELRHFILPTPKPAEQEEMLALLKAAEKNIRAIEGELAAARNLKTSLLQNLLTGKVRVKLEPDYAPAIHAIH